VDKNGNHEEYNAHWWPKIDGVVPEVILKEVPEEDDVILTNVSLSPAVGSILEYLISPLTSI